MNKMLKQNKKNWPTIKILLLILVLIASSLLIIWNFKNFFSNTFLTKVSQTEKLNKRENPSYWTCPMHPQIHSEHSGECPICHMKLVKLEAKPSQEKTSPTVHASAQPIHVSAQQLHLIGIQKHQVEKMDLNVWLPISGRIVSSNKIALQIYEADLRYIQPGLSFQGESILHPEGEISGKIASIDSMADSSSRTIRVLAHILKGPANLPLESSFSGRIKIELKNRLVIPESAVLHTGQGDQVYLFINEKTEASKESEEKEKEKEKASAPSQLKAKTVMLGLKGEGYYEVLEGLERNDLISSGPNFLIDSEAKIRGADSND